MILTVKSFSTVKPNGDQDLQFLSCRGQSWLRSRSRIFQLSRPSEIKINIFPRFRTNCDRECLKCEDWSRLRFTDVKNSLRMRLWISQLFENDENFSTVNTDVKTVSRLSLSIKNHEETPRLNLMTCNLYAHRLKIQGTG